MAVHSLYNRGKPVCGPAQICDAPASSGAEFCDPTFQICNIACTCGDPQMVRCTDDDETQFCANCAASQGCIDLQLTDDDDLSVENGVLSHVLVQLAVKGRKLPNPEDLSVCESNRSDGGNDYGGWFADSFRDFKIGSTLWALHGRSTVANDGTDLRPQLRLEVEQAISEALQYMIDEGYISRFEIETDFDNCGQLCVRYLDIYPPQGVNPRRIDVDCLWQTRQLAAA